MIQNPKIIFTFSDGSTRETSNIIKDSIVFDLQRMKGLDSSTNSLSFTLLREPLYEEDGQSKTLTGKILTEVNDIKAQLLDGDTPLFTGYVTNSKRWSLQKAGLVDIDLTLEDIGTRRLKTPASEEEYIVHDSVSDIIKYLADVSKIEVADDQPEISTETFVTLNSNITCETIMNDLLKEYGYVYFFDAEGKLCWQAINLNPSSEPVKKLWANSNDSRYAAGDGKLNVRSNVAIDMKRDISSYSSAAVCYSTLEERSNQKIFDACSNGSTLSVSGGYWWDGTYHEADSDSFVPTGAFSDNYISALVSRHWKITSWKSGTTAVQIKWHDKIQKSDLIGYVEYSVYLGKKVDYREWDDDSGEYVTKTRYDRVSNKKTISHSFSVLKNVYEKNRDITLNVDGNETPTHVCFEFGSIFGVDYISNLRFGEISVSSSQQGGSVNALDLTKGKKIWEVKNLVPSYTLTSSIQPTEVYIEANENSCNLDVLVNNTNGLGAVKYSKFEASADIVATKEEENWVYSDTELEESGQYKFTSSYIHEKAWADNLVANLSKYYSFCQNEYTFYTSEDLELNSVVQLIDNMFSRLNITVCITKKSYTANAHGTVFKYSGYAISEIGFVSKRESFVVEQRISEGAAKNGDYTEFEFAIGTSSTAAPSSGWTSSVPTRALTSNEYLWMRQRRITY